jgi:multiple sugar transport system ATP-binding protein
MKCVNKIYPGDVHAVRDLDLEIKDKEFIVLVGPSGCGKTTTLRMIAGLESITSGELYIGNNIVNDVPPKDRNIAMVFQNYALYPHMTVFKNMAFGLELRKVPKTQIDKKVREVAGILGIEHLLDRKPKALSGGQRQRVALGRAMVREPDVFLLDEPLSNLDAKLRASTRTEISKLHRQLETTFVYVTHDQTEAMTMGDRIVVMNDGIIQQLDTPQNLYNRPRNVFVAGFIGTPQINFIDGVILQDGDQWYLTIGKDRLLIEHPDAATALSSYKGKLVRLGIRPEDLEDDPDYTAEHPAYTLHTEVDAKEMMGSEAYLYLNYAGMRLTARVKPDTSSEPGNRIAIALRMTRSHLFDPETGEAILNRVI